MKRIVPALVALLLAAAASAQTTITYWQYDFAVRVEAMNRLIEMFQAENPDVRVVHETFPYDGYPQQVAASLPAGQGGTRTGSRNRKMFSRQRRRSQQRERPRQSLLPPRPAKSNRRPKRQ